MALNDTSVPTVTVRNTSVVNKVISKQLLSSHFRRRRGADGGSHYVINNWHTRTERDILYMQPDIHSKTHTGSSIIHWSRHK